MSDDAWQEKIIYKTHSAIDYFQLLQEALYFGNSLGLQGIKTRNLTIYNPNINDPLSPTVVAIEVKKDVIT